MNPFTLSPGHTMQVRISSLLLSALVFVFGICRAQVPVLQTKVTTVGCGTQYGCIRTPTGCESPNCNAVVKWKPSSTGQYLDVQMMAKAPGWVALGLSLDTAMGDDSVTHCSANSSDNNQISVGLSYNVVNNSAGYRANIVLTAPEITKPLENAAATYVDGEVHCGFSRSVQQDGPRVFALNQQYYLLMAYGPSNNGVKQVHTGTTVSQDPVDVMSGTGIYGPGEKGASGGPQGTGDPGSLEDGHGNQILYKPSGDGKFVQFTLIRTLSSANAFEWVALGFSNDNSMKDDSVIECARLHDGSVVARNSYNEQKYNRPSNPSNVGIMSPMTNYSNGMIRCDLMRPVSGVGNSDVFDLTRPYIPFIASGPVNNDGTKAKHTNARSLGTKINFADNNTISQQAGGGGASPLRMKRAHGILMITAWVLLVSTSIIIARYYKTCWPEKKLCTTDVWFSLHRFLMLLALACTIAAFIMIFYVNKGKLSDYAPGSPSYFWVHAPLGIVVMILVILNPLMAAFRCHPGTTYRPIFNWLHWCVGTCAHVIALITIFFGIKIGELGSTRICHMAVFWIMIAFVGFHVAIEILLSLDRCIAESRSKRSFQVQYEMSKPGEVPRVIEPTVGSCSVIFRYIVLAFYFIVVLGLWLAMIILIGLGKID